MAEAQDEGRIPTRRERYAFGKSLRQKTPRERHGAFSVPQSRDPVAILAESDSQRIAKLLPVRYLRMEESPFTFLRGAAAVMASDLVDAPKAGIGVQACGDCHLFNFGAFATPEDNILFDINDFDETLPGVDFTVDLKRLTASMVVAGQAAGLSAGKARETARSTANTYRLHMRALAQLTPLEVWHSRIDLNEQIEEFAQSKVAQRLRATLTRARAKLDRDDQFPHLAKTRKGVPQIADRPPLIYHFDAKDPANSLDAEKAFRLWRETLAPEHALVMDRFHLVDTAVKVVGVGSVGTFCAIGLFVSGDGDPLFLQIKEALTSVLERLDVDTLRWTREGGRRVVEGQRIMQAASDPLLGWTGEGAGGRDFYVRQLKNRRLGSIGELLESQALPAYARLCGRTLARAHARSCDPSLIAGYLGKSEAMDNALASFAVAYTKQTKLDHAALVAAKRPHVG